VYRIATGANAGYGLLVGYKRASLIIMTSNIKPFFCTAYCSKKDVCCRWRQFGTSAEMSARHFGTGTTLSTQTLRYQLDGAEMSSPKCPVLSKVDDFATFKKVEVV